MKPLFFLLCVLNLVVLLWQFHVGHLTTTAQPSGPESASIVLLSEYQRAQRGVEISRIVEQKIERWQKQELDIQLANLRHETWQAKGTPVRVVKKPGKLPEPSKVAEAPKPPVKPVEKKCFEAGPFADEISLKKWLNNKALDGKQISQKDLVLSSDFQVYFPAAKKPEQISANKAMLQAKGLLDIWMIPDGELKGSFSLGVFREKQRAMNFKSQLADMGIQADVKQRDKTKSQWFVRVFLDKANLQPYQSSGINVSSCSAN